ncbi:hypothetical protein [Leptospira paudalimensis]|uniref:Uncharacterized protein n=1 Tax=Leptospira paudalimensis TaxID=2950024 RepID=A0ABT3M598_9LEPT|nr:hypothetical protein [Leptospira paudalimensis]MCW7503556.1 hypothetical protein [Leptospira paudalimensis]
MNILDEIKNSINSVIAERSVSPLFGTFLISWLSWNWKIIYALFGTGKYLDFEDRLEFIETYYSDNSYLFVYPIISTILLLILYPLLSITAYWIWLHFDILKKKIRNNAERSELLTLDESIKIRIELQKSKELTANLVIEKDREIDQLKKQLEIQISENIKISQIKEEKEKKANSKEKASISEKIKSNKKLTDALNGIFECYKKGIPYKELKSNISDNSLAFFTANRVISELNGDIHLLYLGEELYKDYLNNLFE